MEKRMEKRIPVQAIQISCICDKCKCGELQSTGDVQGHVYPRLIEHCCSHCGVFVWLRGEKYPKIVYEPIAGNEPDFQEV